MMLSRSSGVVERRVGDERWCWVRCEYFCVLEVKWEGDVFELYLLSLYKGSLATTANQSIMPLTPCIQRMPRYSSQGYDPTLSSRTNSSSMRKGSTTVFFGCIHSHYD
jgi:hypothetical protein